MAKTIKFNLKCDGSSIRTLDDLREHFCVQDVLGYYKSGLLDRWMCVQGYEDERAQMKKIDASSDESIMMGLSKLFGIESDEKEIKKSLKILEFSTATQQYQEILARGSSIESRVLDEYKKRYEELVTKIIKNKDNYTVIKAAVKTILKNFMWIVEIDFSRLFERLYVQAPMAVFCLASMDNFRKYIIPDFVEASDGKVYLDVELTYDHPDENLFYSTKKCLYEKLCYFLSESKLKEILGENLRSFSENTDSYWKDIEPDERKKFLILSMSSGAMVRSLRNKGEELKSGDVDSKFVILNGIDYKNNYNYKLLYMEV